MFITKIIEEMKDVFKENPFGIEHTLKVLQNVSIVDGKTAITDFQEPISVHAKIPHIRRLIYVEDGISVTIEAETDIILNGNSVDEIKSLERYKQTDEELVNMMKSLIE